ncbi:hypothetical protein Tco_0976437 [Tanacetum coccineum]|uniref:Uncharacterized protein n=1 Tax=Tanacetum coccineum TaxID=301880 RepID=A0ABQ5EH89_9ASTR
MSNSTMTFMEPTLRKTVLLCLTKRTMFHGYHTNVLKHGDAGPVHSFSVSECFMTNTNDDELTEAEIKQMEADDQAIQTILLGLPEDIYAVVDSCETAQEIWFTSTDGESIESYYHRNSDKVVTMLEGWGHLARTAQSDQGEGCSFNLSYLVAIALKGRSSNPYKLKRLIYGCCSGSDEIEEKSIQTDFDG